MGAQGSILNQIDPLKLEVAMRFGKPYMLDDIVAQAENLEDAPDVLPAEETDSPEIEQGADIPADDGITFE